jgi:hypothetical protein
VFDLLLTILRDIGLGYFAVGIGYATVRQIQALVTMRQFGLKPDLKGFGSAFSIWFWSVILWGFFLYINTCAELEDRRS